MLEDKNNTDELFELSTAETKHFLTPFAFTLDKKLLGLPLASPSKRGFAILIDLVIIALISDISGVFLAFAIAVTLYYLGKHKSGLESNTKKGRKRRAVLRFSAAFILFVVLLDTLPPLMKYVSDDAIVTLKEAESNQNIVIIKDKKNLKVAYEKPAEPNKPLEHVEKDGVYSIIGLIKGLINDLGLGFGWATLYFTAFTALWQGQTIGKKLLGIKVLQLDGTPLSMWDSFGRYGGYGAGLATGLLGFLQIFWDANRQAIHDKISSTVVIDLKAARLKTSAH